MAQPPDNLHRQLPGPKSTHEPLPGVGA